MRPKNIKAIAFSLCLLLIFFFTKESIATKTSTESVAILPFDVHATEDLSYLRNGIRDMLASRLATGVGGVTIVSKSKVVSILGTNTTGIQADKFPSLAEQLNAKYLVSGSYTSLDGGASIDAKVYSSSLRTTQDFFATAPGQTDIIMAINNLAWDIGEKVFGKAKPAQAIRPSQSSQVAQVQQPAPVYQTAHPEQAYMGNSAGGGRSPFIRPTGISGAFSFTKTQNFNMKIQAMEVGDVNGDGVDEIVLADQKHINVYSRTDRRLQLVAKFPMPTWLKVHYLSLADLNNNNILEIYVSAADISKPYSYILELQGDKLIVLDKEVPYYLRALKIPAEGTVLLGQKSSVDNLFEPGVFILKKGKKKFRKTREITLPNNVNLFDFIITDLDTDGRTEVVAIDQNDRLTVMRQAGKVIWKSPDYFGGTTRFVGGEKGRFDSGSYDYVADEAHINRVYVPASIIAGDFNQDGQPDVVINKNLSADSGEMQRTKSYPNGEIYCLSWNGVALDELWHTKRIDGYIADYRLKLDPNDKSKGALYVSIILTGQIRDMFSSSESTILIYPLDFGSQEFKAQTDTP